MNEKSVFIPCKLCTWFPFCRVMVANSEIKGCIVSENHDSDSYHNITYKPIKEVSE